MDLNRNFLEAVPGGLFQDLLGGGGDLSVGKSSLNELPEGTFDGQAAYLSVLDLSANRLETAVGTACCETWTHSSRCRSRATGSSDLPSGLFDDLAEARGVLDLSANSINELPDGVFDRNLELRGLDLSINEISGLPEGVFGGLGDLQRLSLAGNDLKSLPEDMFADLGSLAETGRFGKQAQGPACRPLRRSVGADGLSTRATTRAHLSRSRRSWSGGETIRSWSGWPKARRRSIMKVELSARNGESVR